MILTTIRRRLRHPLGGRLSRLLRDLSGASGDAFRGYLLGALDATIEGGVLVRRLVVGEIASVAASEEMRGIEHRGDDERAKLVTDLRTALITPIDREDLFRLSRSIDDILDNLRDFVYEWALFEMQQSSRAAAVAALIADAIVDLRVAVEALVADQRTVTSKALAAKKSINAIQRMLEVQMVLVLTGDVTTQMLRERELLHRLDIVGRCLGAAADALADAIVKRADN